MNNIIELKSLSKNYHSKTGEIPAIKEIDLKIHQGEVLSIIGPSGCGKSTLLSLISGLDKDYTGFIKKDNNIRTAYMLQSDALLPFLTVYENAILGLKIKKVLTPENIYYVEELLKLYNLDEFKNNYPSNLSGGMRQRVALIRTLALKPELLLLDEPFSALDNQTRLIISNDVKKVIKEKNITTILVTHNIEEAITFSDRIVVLTNRPSEIKSIIDIKIDEIDDVYKRRLNPKFNEYFDKIWKDLNHNE